MSHYLVTFIRESTESVLTILVGPNDDKRWPASEGWEKLLVSEVPEAEVQEVREYINGLEEL